MKIDLQNVYYVHSLHDINSLVSLVEQNSLMKTILNK